MAGGRGCRHEGAVPPLRGCDPSSLTSSLGSPKVADGQNSEETPRLPENAQWTRGRRSSPSPGRRGVCTSKGLSEERTLAHPSLWYRQLRSPSPSLTLCLQLHTPKGHGHLTASRLIHNQTHPDLPLPPVCAKDHRKGGYGLRTLHRKSLGPRGQGHGYLIKIGEGRLSQKLLYKREAVLKC